MRPRPPVGYSSVEGRLTKTKETTRPGNVWPEIWRTLSKKQKGKAIKDWQQFNAERDRERAQRDISHVPDDEVDAYTKMLSQARKKHSTTEATAMPLMRGESLPASAVTGDSSADLRGATPCPKHQDNIGPARQATSFGLLWCILLSKIGEISKGLAKQSTKNRTSSMEKEPDSTTPSENTQKSLRKPRRKTERFISES